MNTGLVYRAGRTGCGTWLLLEPPPAPKPHKEPKPPKKKRRSRRDRPLVKNPDSVTHILDESGFGSGLGFILDKPTKRAEELARLLREAQQ